MSGYDVIVVGAGNAALCAAISAAQHGAKVVVLERAPHHERGGNSWFTDGAIRFAHGGIADVRELIPDMTDAEASRIDLPPYPAAEFLADMERTSDGWTDPSLARTLANESLNTMGWLRDQGVPFAMLYDNQSFEVDGRFHFWGNLSIKVDGKGVGLIEALTARAVQLGVHVRYDAGAINLVRDAEAEWTVLVSDRGAVDSVFAPTVVLASGGFEANSEERVRYLGEEWDAAIVRGTRHNTGDGLKFAIAAGAVRYGDWAGCHAVATDANAPPTGDFTKPGDVFKKHSYPLGIVVNVLGRRFIDEGADFRNYTYARYGKEVLVQPRGIAYQIFDAQVVDRLRAEYRASEATSVEAQTLAELAEKIDIQRDAFLATVRSYNEAVQDGEFNPERLDGKGTLDINPPKSNWALRLEQPPFLAFPVTCGITFTFGGVRVSERAQILDEHGSPIEGLFAAGEMVGGLFYGNYPGGAGLISGATFGRIAGREAASRA